MKTKPCFYCLKRTTHTMLVRVDSTTAVRYWCCRTCYELNCSPEVDEVHARLVVAGRIPVGASAEIERGL